MTHQQAPDHDQPAGSTAENSASLENPSVSHSPPLPCRVAFTNTAVGTGKVPGVLGMLWWTFEGLSSDQTRGAPRVILSVTPSRRPSLLAAFAA